MAHFAKISEENVVIHVTPLEDSLCNDSESEGQAYLEKHNNWPAHLWIKASYNTRTNKYFNNATGLLDSDQSKTFRGNFPGIGYTWDATNQIFWPPQPYPSWTKNISAAAWDPPLAIPTLTDEQKSQNAANTHHWYHEWNETAYQADNNAGWDLKDGLA
jgi:hypothetical protein|tara:strand:- start:946 stop:1422 length:477 start_codon:yes stop_codon:yes gene_type:complete